MRKSDIEYDDALNLAAWSVLEYLSDRGVEVYDAALFNNLKTALKVGIDKYTDIKNGEKK